jgi:hypothetical protein
MAAGQDRKGIRHLETPGRAWRPRSLARSGLDRPARAPACPGLQPPPGRDSPRGSEIRQVPAAHAADRKHTLHDVHDFGGSPAAAGKGRARGRCMLGWWLHASMFRTLFRPLVLVWQRHYYSPYVLYLFIINMEVVYFFPYVHDLTHHIISKLSLFIHHIENNLTN